jgi:hypothetical protein
MKVLIIYPDKTESATTEIILTKRSLVISPWVLVAVGGLVAFAVWWFVHRRKRRKAPESVRPRRGQSQTAVKRPPRDPSGPRHARSDRESGVRRLIGRSRTRVTVK